LSIDQAVRKAVENPVDERRNVYEKATQPRDKEIIDVAYVFVSLVETDIKTKEKGNVLHYGVRFDEKVQNIHACELLNQIQEIGSFRFGHPMPASRNTFGGFQVGRNEIELKLLRHTALNH